MGVTCVRVCELAARQARSVSPGLSCCVCVHAELERAQGMPILQCSYFEVGTAEQCLETAVSRLGLCPEHHTYR